MDKTMTQKSKIYAVTGGAGFIGSSLVRSLVHDGHKVRVLDDLSRGASKRLRDVEKHIEIVFGDIRTPSIVHKFIKDVDCVCHLAFINGTENFYNKPDLVLDVAVRGMLNILDACREYNVREFLLTSSSEAYQTPPMVPTPEDVPLSVPDVLNPRYSYGGGKIINELMLINRARTEFNRAIIVRPHNVYGPDMGDGHVVSQFIKRLMKLNKEQPLGTLDFPIQGTGEETRAFAYISDLIAGIKIALDNGEHMNVYHVGNDEEISLADLSHKVAACFGREINLVKGPLQPGSTLRRCPDISKLRKLGFEPKVSLKEGLQTTVEWYRGETQ
jgi:UDP-glucose 4-epimerase